MDMYGSDFEYNGVPSTTYNLVVASIDVERMRAMSGEIAGRTFFSRSARKNYLIGNDYSSSPLQFEIEFISGAPRPLTHAERRVIEKWLFNRHTYRPFYVGRLCDAVGETYEIIDDTEHRLYFNCRFMNPQKIETTAGIIGYHCMMETDSLLLWQDPITKSFLTTNKELTNFVVRDAEDTLSNLKIRKYGDASFADGRSFSVNRQISFDVGVSVDTDIDGYTYPIVQMTFGSDGGNLSIVNMSDSSTRITGFSNMPAGSRIIMNGNLNYVTEAYYDNFTSQNFIRLLDGDNDFRIDGDIVEIQFTWQNRRFL